MLSFAKVLTAAIVTRNLFLGTSFVNGFDTGQDHVLSRNDGKLSSTLGRLGHKPYEHKDNTLFVRKLLQTNSTNGPWTPAQKVMAGDGEAGDAFGYSIALDDTTLVVGAPSYYGNSSGSVYVYEKTNNPQIPWSLLEKLTPKDGEAGDYFGYSIALDGTTLVVGAPSYYWNSSGYVYVYEKTNNPESPWSLLEKLTPKNGETGDDFGYSMALDGTTLLVGAPNDFGRGTFFGSVYVFEKSSVPGESWTQTAKLIAEDGAFGDEFGLSIALDGTTLVVGAPSYYSNSSGFVYIYEKTNNTESPWSFLETLTPKDGEPDGYFGYSIILDGTTLLVGAPYDDDRGSFSGSVYVFEKSSVPGMSWTQSAKLTAEDGEAEDYFGWSIALDGTTLFVGVYDNDRGNGTGSVYIYEKSNVPEMPWTQSTKLIAEDGEAFDDFGWSIALHGNTLIVSAPWDDDRGSDSGSVYIFQSEAFLTPPPLTPPSFPGPPLSPTGEIGLTTSFPLSTCQAFEGLSKQATVRAFCTVIVSRANFPEDTFCIVESSTCTATSPGRVLLQTASFEAKIVQQGTFGGFTQDQVEANAIVAVSNIEQFKEQVVRVLQDDGSSETAEVLNNTLFSEARVETNGDPPPIDNFNKCNTGDDCDGETPYCLNEKPSICVQCLTSNDCTSGTCSALNVCVPLPSPSSRGWSVPSTLPLVVLLVSCVILMAI